MEEYVIKYNLKKPDGYYSYGEVTSVFVPVKHGINEKCNHVEAIKLFHKKYPKEIAEVVRCQYG